MWLSPDDEGSKILSTPSQLVLWFLTMMLATPWACSRPPKVAVSDIQSSQVTRPGTSGIEDDEGYRALVASLHGKQIGDVIFEERTSALLVTEVLDIASLERARRSAQFGIDEFEARIKRTQDIHDNFLVFSLNLRLPFHAGWSRSQLLSFLEENLIVTLETHGKRSFTPSRQLFDIDEAFQDSLSDRLVNSHDRLGLHVPLRVFFSRKENDFGIADGGSVVLKLRLRENLPYVISFWDEQFYQGFQWRVVKTDQVEKRSTVR